MDPRRQRTREWSQIRFDFPIGWQGAPSLGAEPIQIRLELASGPQLIEGGIEVAGQQCGAAEATVMSDCQHQLLGEKALRLRIPLAAAGRFRPTVGDHLRPGRQRTDRRARSLVQLSA
jgi:hypothetical protein